MTTSRSELASARPVEPADGGPATSHGEELARFLDSSETRQLFARDLREPADAPLVYMPEGGAPGLREACREGGLVCPLPGCVKPAYVARGGSRRHHFAHRPGAGAHAPERFYHHVGKQLLAAWVQRKQPQATITVEGRIETGQVADVLVRSGVTGRRYAFELQYSALTIAEWQARHDGYHSVGVTDVWLFGHTRPQLRQARGEPEGRVALSPLLVAMVRARLPVRFFNPDERAIATALAGPHLADLREAETLRAGEPRCAPRGTAGVGVDPLDSCGLTGDGILTPTDTRLLQAAGAHDRTQEKRDAEWEEWLRTAEEAREAERRAEQLAREAEERRQLDALRREAEERRAKVAEWKQRYATENPVSAERYELFRQLMQLRRPR